MIFDLDRLRMEYAKIYQVDEGSARREPLGGSLSEPSGLINASFLCLTPFILNRSRGDLNESHSLPLREGGDITNSAV